MFDWDRFFSLAEELADRPDEAAQRSAISRAYHALFCLSRRWLLERGYVFPSGRHRHHDVWNELIFQRQPAVWTGINARRRQLARSLGNDGHRLSDRRIEADYEEVAHELLDELKSEMNRARQMRQSLDQLG